MSFGENLQTIRAQYGLTQEQLAEQMEVSRQSVSKWESGMSYPEMETLLKICDLYHVSLDDLLRGKVKEKNVEEAARFEKHIRSFANRIAFSVGAIIASTGLGGLLSEISDNVGGAVFFAILTIAVVVLIAAGMEHDDFKKKHPQITAFHTEQEVEEFEHRFIWRISGAVGAIMAGILLWILLDSESAMIGMFEVSDLLGAVFLWIVAAATTVLIQTGIQRQIYHVEEYHRETKKIKDKDEGGLLWKINSCIMLFATMVFFVYGFLGSWHGHNGWDEGWDGGFGISWLAFPIGGLLCAIASVIFSKKEK